MVKVCLDLPIILNYLRGQSKAVEKIDIYLNRRDVELCISALILSDLYIALKDPLLVEELVEHLTVLPFDDVAAKISRDVYDVFEERGVRASIHEIRLAATCLANDALLLTEQRDIYGAIPQLKVV